MCTTIKRKLLSLSVFLLLLSCGFTSQAETMYLISETELNQLEKNTAEQKASAESRQKKLDEQDKLLKKADESIRKSESRNKEIQERLNQANRYLDEYEQEVQHKMAVKNGQLIFWKTVAGVLLFAWIKK